MKKAKTLTILAAGTLATSLALSACGTTDTQTETTTTASLEYANQTVTGVIESISDNTISINLSKNIVDSSDAQGSNPGASSSGDGSTPPDMPSGDGSSDGNAPSGDGSTPPDMPSGDGNSDGNAPSGDGSSDAGSQSTDGNTPPEKPSDDGSSDGNAPSGDGSSDGNAPSGDGSSDAGAPSGDGSSESKENSDSTDASSEETTTEAEITLEFDVTDVTAFETSDGDTITVSDLSVDDIITVTFDENQSPEKIVLEKDKTVMSDMGGNPGGQGSPGGGSSNADITYTAVVDYTEDADDSDVTVNSDGTDEEAILIEDGATVKLDGATVSRNSSDSTGGDNSSFYGVGAAILNTSGTAYINNAEVSTDAKGGAGIFSYGDGVTYVNNATIETTQDTSGGLHAAGGGTLYAWDSTATTNGESSAAIRSDRGGGTMVIDGGTYTSKGTGSPAVYCTAEISINDSDLTAEGSEAVCIEGLNSLRLYDCNLTGNMPTNEQNDIDWNIILYQSMSGDSEVGTSTFEMNGGTLTAKNGGMFYTTNTSSCFYLNDVDITYSDDNPFFLQVTGNTNARGWGSEGSNGAECTFTADNQEMTGDIIYDSISSLDFYMENGSTLTGGIIDDETWAGNGGTANANLSISKDSKWIVTKDSTLTTLSNEGTIVDSDGKTVSIVGTDGTEYVKGDSSITVTVENYNTTCDFSDAYTQTSFDDYAVENPF